MLKYRKLTWGEYRELNRIRAEKGFEDGISFVLFAAVIDDEGKRKFASVEEVEASVDCDVALETFEAIRTLSGLVAPDESAEKNAG